MLKIASYMYLNVPINQCLFALCLDVGLCFPASGSGQLTPDQRDPYGSLVVSGYS